MTASLKSTWRFDEAREHLDELIRRAREDGPQTIQDADGVGTVVVTGRVVDQGGDRRTWSEVLGPLVGSGIDLSRTVEELEPVDWDPFGEPEPEEVSG